MSEAQDLRGLFGAAKHQGNRSTCVAFAATACHEASCGGDSDFAEEAVYWGALQIEGPGDGISFYGAGLTLGLNGQPDSAAWPYSGELDVSADDYGPPGTAEACRPWRTCVFGRVAVVIDEFKKSLTKGVPVSIMIPMFTEFWDPVSGEIVAPDNPDFIDGNHAIVLVGYDEAGKRFLFRNSWGEDWGDRGHAHIAYEFIANYALDAAIVLRSPIP